MLRDPGAAPAVVVAPTVGVHVEGAVIEGLDGEVLDEVHAFVAAVGVAAVAAGVAGGQPPFVAERDHVVRVEGFDVCGDGAGPGGDDGGGAAGAARLVAELPAEDRGRGFVPVDDEGDVVLVGGLAAAVGVEAGVRAAEGGCVGVYPAQGVEVVEEGEDELDAVGFGGGYYVV